MLENWIWDKDILRKVSKHYKTGEPLSTNLVDAKVRSRNDMVATATLNQIFLGTLDLMLYSAADEKLLSASKSTALSETHATTGISTWRRDIKMKGKYIVDTERLWHELAQKIEHSTLQPHTNPIGSFGHIFSGYESQYYSYLWSKVYSCELF
jgi:Zn-dependent oligopeptidase